MTIIRATLSFEDLKQMAGRLFGDMVKAVVDVDRELLAVDAELHADLEAGLLEDGSQQKSLWGINLRPSQGNRSRSVEDEAIRKKIIAIVKKRIAR